MDFLQKKTKKNEGEVPQYYVEGNHEAIIDPATFDYVQAEMARRMKDKHRYSGVSMFSSKIKCGECGCWYGSKVWHSTDKYRRVIYQCNHKYKGGKTCGTPHVTEKQVKGAFVRATNILLSERDELTANTRMVIVMLCDSTELEKRQAELKEELEHPLKENVFYDVDLKVYCFADGSVWKFSEKEIITTAGDHFFQVLASEVSELYRNKVLLKEENQKLQEMSVAMKELSKNVITLTREEEMLSMKMRVHDNLGYSVLAAQRMLLRESEADRDVFLSQWKQTLDLLNKDNESVKGEQLHRQVQERAKVLGVKIIYTGEKVWESHISELMDIILLEALSNCVRHAGASELYVKFSIEEQEWVMVLTDNGQKPEKNIKEGGGLSGIRKRVEQCGGSMRITAAPRFSITVKLLREVRR